MSGGKEPQNIEYPLLIFILCGFSFDLNINKSSIRALTRTKVEMGFSPKVKVG
jgi:hypothetical protein